MSGRAWRHTCLACGSVYFGSRCRIVCDECFAAGAAKARGTCLVCGAKVPFHPRARNKGPLFCRACRHERALDSVRRSKGFHHVSSIVLTPTYEEGVVDGEPSVL